MGSGSGLFRKIIWKTEYLKDWKKKNKSGEIQILIHWWEWTFHKWDGVWFSHPTLEKVNSGLTAWKVNGDFTWTALSTIVVVEAVGTWHGSRSVQWRVALADKLCCVHLPALVSCESVAIDQHSTPLTRASLFCLISLLAHGRILLLIIMHAFHVSKRLWSLTTVVSFPFLIVCLFFLGVSYIFHYLCVCACVCLVSFEVMMHFCHLHSLPQICHAFPSLLWTLICWNLNNFNWAEDNVCQRSGIVCNKFRVQIHAFFLSNFFMVPFGYNLNSRSFETFNLSPCIFF